MEYNRKLYLVMIFPRKSKILNLDHLTKLHDNHDFDTLTPKISLIILLTVCHTILMMSTWRIWYCINQ